MVTHFIKPSVVVISASEYARLKQRDKRDLVTEDLTEWMMNRIGDSEMDPRFAHFDESG